MKNLVIALVVTCMSMVCSYGQTPGTMSYQAVMRNTNGQLLSSAQVGMRISILQGSSSGTALYVETQMPTTNANGLLTMVIGEGVPVSGSLDNIDWGAGPFFIKTEADADGGTNYSITATNPILSVPYALRALIADSAHTTLDAAYHAGNSVNADNGVFTIAGTEGLRVEGIYNSGSTIQPVNDNTPVMYFNPRKVAFRAGIASGGKWDEGHVGYFSTALGYNTSASGNYATALGEVTAALGDAATAMGYNSTASGNSSTAMGDATIASGNYSTAMGTHVSTNGHSGTFIIGDNTNTMLYADADNQFMTRFSGGYKLSTNGNGTVGVRLNPGGNSWVTISDSTRKENFLPVDETDFLAKIGSMKLGSWNYKGQDPKMFRHYGPMAQDFYAAFGKDGLGTIGNDTTINQADMMAVNIIAIQGLIRENNALKTAIAEQATNMRKLEATLSQAFSSYNQSILELANLKKQVEALVLKETSPAITGSTSSTAVTK